MRGRVTALFTMVFIGSTPVGGPLLGWIGEHLGARAGLAVGGIATLAAGVAVLALLRWRSAAPTGEQVEEAPVSVALLEAA